MRPTAFSFFLEYAGYSYNPATESEYAGRVRGALALAQAEALARESGCSFDWDVDPDIDSSEFSDDRYPWHLWYVLARDDAGHVFASLSGVDFGRDGEPWGDSYKRVVEAELALEFKPDTE